MQLGVQLAKDDVTAIFSNLGVVSLPREYVPYIRRFGVFTSTPKIELSMCSFEDDLVLSFASCFRIRILNGIFPDSQRLRPGLNCWDRFPAKNAGI